MKKTPKMLEVEKREGRPVEQILKEEYEVNRKTFREIAGRFGVDRSTVEDWAKKFGIRSRSPKEARLSYLKKQPSLHVDICLCQFCNKQSDCQDSKESHRKGQCVWRCISFEAMPGSHSAG